MGTDMPRLPPGLDDFLALAPSQSTPVLLELARRQAGRRKPADLLRQREDDKFVHPSMIDARLSHQVDGLAYAAAPEYEALLLSPVAPLGVCSVVGLTSQDRTLTTTRGSEVVSDPTNVLCVEAARRPAPARLCTVHQTLRAQALPPGEGFSRHFRLFVLVDAGPARGEDGFEVDAVAAQIGVFDRLFDAAAAIGCQAPGRKAIVRADEVLAARVAARLGKDFPHVQVEREPLTHAYYHGLKVSFGAESKHGFVPLGDIGRFDWLARLRSDRRQRFVAGGFGVQLLPLLFR
jgi:hypothetical protein